VKLAGIWVFIAATRGANKGAGGDRGCRLTLTRTWWKFLSTLLPFLEKSIQQRTGKAKRASTPWNGSRPSAVLFLIKGRDGPHHGYYSNLFRGKRQKEQGDEVVPFIIESDRSSKEYRIPKDKTPLEQDPKRLMINTGLRIHNIPPVKYGAIL
jgi:hypothetical protein